MSDKTLTLMTGVDYLIDDLSLVAYQPKLREIAFIGEREITTASHFLCLDHKQVSKGESDLSALSNFQIVMTVLHEEENKDVLSYAIDLLKLTFPNYSVALTPRSIFFRPYQEGAPMTVVDENNFIPLQNAISEIYCVKGGAGGGPVFKPGDARARAIAEKIEAGRRKIAAERAAKSGGCASVLTKYLSIMIVARVVSVSDALNLTLFQLYDIFERYTLFVQWDLDLRAKLAGGKPDSEVDNWMKSLY